MDTYNLYTIKIIEMTGHINIYYKLSQLTIIHAVLLDRHD